MASIRGMDEAAAKLSTLISGRKSAGLKTWEDFGRYVQWLGLGPGLAAMDNVVHVSGTKGKGSTCAFVESILRKCGKTTALYTSPHLVDIKERFLFNGVPVSEEIFLESFWPTWDVLTAKVAEANKGGESSIAMPGYFHFLTLVGLTMFQRHKTDAVILEVGIGGRLDATNVVPHPAACGVASLGYDHMEILGYTLDKIAGEKAGIFKRGTPAFTVAQPEEAMPVLVRQAEELQIPLEVVPPLERYALPPGTPSPPPLGLSGAHQTINASLAVQLARTWLRRRVEKAGEQADPLDKRRLQELDSWRLPQEFVDGLASAFWPGRAQVVTDESVEGGRLRFYLDGAHTAESLEVCAQWFCDQAMTNAYKVLIFNCMAEREPQRLLAPFARVLQERGVHIDRAIFAPNDSQVMAYLTHQPTQMSGRDTSWQSKIMHVWHGLAASPTNLLHPITHARTHSPHEQAASTTPAKETPDKSQSTMAEICSDRGGGQHEDFPLLTARSQDAPASARGSNADTLGLPCAVAVSGGEGRADGDGLAQGRARWAVMESLSDTMEWVRAAAVRAGSRTSAAGVAAPRAPAYTQVLVTGSLHLVGDILRILKKCPYV
eukprot:jgi/Mesvir1/2167/Mv16679-RA.1